MATHGRTQPVTVQYMEAGADVLISLDYCTPDSTELLRATVQASDVRQLMSNADRSSTAVFVTPRSIYHVPVSHDVLLSVLVKALRRQRELRGDVPAPGDRVRRWREKLAAWIRPSS